LAGGVKIEQQTSAYFLLSLKNIITSLLRNHTICDEALKNKKPLPLNAMTIFSVRKDHIDGKPAIDFQS
jgi:hypothetical protein